MTRQPSLFNRVARSGLPTALKAAFERFWAAYPARAQTNPRAVAEAEFAALVRDGVEAEQLVGAAAAYAAHCKAKCVEPLYRWQARTFLGAGHWRDFLATDPAPPPVTAAPAAEAAPAHFLDALRATTTELEWRLWLGPLSLHSITDGEIALIAAPTRYAASHARSQYRSAIRAALRVKQLDILSMEEIHP